MKSWPIAAVALCSCTSLNRYTSPRTMPAGSFAVTATSEANYGGGTVIHSDYGELPEVLPRPGVRFGLMSGTELGIEVGAGNASLDWKQRLVDSRSFALALDPTLAIGYAGDATAVLGQLPLLFGINLTRWLALVPQGSVGYGMVVTDGDTYEGALIGAGMGLAVQIGESFALVPAVGTTFELGGPHLYTSYGLGIAVGPHLGGP